jgi:hypothetical protein
MPQEPKSRPFSFSPFFWAWPNSGFVFVAGIFKTWIPPDFNFFIN